MKCTMRIVKMTFKQCWFQIMGSPEWEVIGKRTYKINCAEFGVYQNGKLQYVLKQTNPITRFLSDFLMCKAFYETPFYFYRDGVKCGTWKSIQHPTFIPGRWEFYFEGKTYRVELGPYAGLKDMFRTDWRPRHTLFVNGRKAAEYTRDFEMEPSIVHVKYPIEYTEELVERPDILLLFGAFVENYMDWDGRNGWTYTYNGNN